MTDREPDIVADPTAKASESNTAAPPSVPPPSEEGTAASPPPTEARLDDGPVMSAAHAPELKSPNWQEFPKRDTPLATPRPAPPAPVQRPPTKPPLRQPDPQPPRVEEPPPPPEPRKLPEWKVLEPEDPSDPVAHELCNAHPRNAQWRILAASVRGKLHAHKALWRDDAYAYGEVDDWTILVVSDGAGSARISRIGARLACDESVRVLKDLLTGYCFTTPGGDLPAQSDLRRMRTFLSEAARKAQMAILREAHARSCPARDLNATFLLVLHRPWNDRDFVGMMQVGDGAVGLFLDDDTCTVLGVADHGDYSSETRFLTTPGIEHEFDQRVQFCCKKGVRCLAVMCDGVSDDFFPEDKRLIELFIGNPIQALKTRAGEPVYGVMKTVVPKTEGEQALLEWLRYDKRQSSDDRTLLLMHRRDLT